MSARSCDQLCPITADLTDHQGTDDQCSPSSATCHCPSVPALSAHPCHLPVPISATSMPHISATYQCCQSVPPISVSQCRLSVPVSATYQCASVPPIIAHQCCLSVPPNSASQCHLSVPYISAAFQCPSVMPVNAHQCHLPVPPHQCPSVPPISVHQCSLSVPITAASLAHISEGEKSLDLQNFITKTKKKTFFFNFQWFLVCLGKN
ncbi:unnamed protein product, partial [Staurois parvus]